MTLLKGHLNFNRKVLGAALAALIAILAAFDLVSAKAAAALAAGIAPILAAIVPEREETTDTE